MCACVAFCFCPRASAAGHSGGGRVKWSGAGAGAAWRPWTVVGCAYDLPVCVVVGVGRPLTFTPLQEGRAGRNDNALRGTRGQAACHKQQ